MYGVGLSQLNYIWEELTTSGSKYMSSSTYIHSTTIKFGIRTTMVKLHFEWWLSLILRPSTQLVENMLQTHFVLWLHHHLKKKKSLQHFLFKE